MLNMIQIFIKAILEHLLVLFFRNIWFVYFVGSGAGFWFWGLPKRIKI